MFFRQIYEPGLAHASYMVGCQKTGECLVIDAKRDVDTYLDIAKQEGLRITHITETHIHADFLCGSRELSQLTGAEILLSDEGGPDWQYELDHTGLRDGNVFMVGNIRIETVHTPGHTPEHICFLVTDTPAISNVPVMMFTGDFVFVGDIGRPDLLEKAAGITGTMETGARQMWESLKKFRALPDHIQVHPAHGAGSACGKALGAVPSSTVGYEKLVNWALQHTNEQDFVDELLSGQPEPPLYFAQMKKLNKVHRDLLTSVPDVPEVSLDEVSKAISQGAFVVDSRNKQLFAEGHLAGTLNVQLMKSFSNWAGWVLPYNEPFYVIVQESLVNDVMRRLMRIGLDNLAGYLPSSVLNTDVALEKTTEVSTDELRNAISAADAVVLDVRGASEYTDGHIPTAMNIHTGHLQGRLDDVPRDKPVIVSCQTGVRSSLAASILLRAGFTNIKNYPPGFAGWQASGEEIEHESSMKEPV